MKAKIILSQDSANEVFFVAACTKILAAYYRDEPLKIEKKPGNPVHKRYLT